MKLIACSILFASAFSASPVSFKVKATHSAPAGWSEQSAAPLDYTMNLQIGLKQQNMEKLHQELLTVSDPKSPRYGQHLTKAQVESLVAPSAESVAAVTKWLHDNGISEYAFTSSKDYVTLPNISVDKVQSLLATQYAVFQHSDSGNKLVRASSSYSLPTTVHDHIEVIEPTLKFGSMWEGPKKSSGLMAVPQSSAPLAGCSGNITPDCLRSLYNVGTFTPSHPANSIGITGFLGEYASLSDLSSFQKSYNGGNQGKGLNVVLINGGKNDQSNPGTEANLDVQVIGALTAGIKNTFYSTAGKPPYNGNTDPGNEPYIEFINYIASLADADLPKVISTSYGDNENTVPIDYANNVCNGFAKLGARGVTVVFASGDGGVGGGQSGSTGSCPSVNGKKQFTPTFPAGCPWVTAVGGTSGTGSETAGSLSTGGFSNYFGVPSYQSTATKSYVSSIGSQYSGQYNASGRGFPDVAAQCYSFAIVQGGSKSSVSGTSASAPSAAGIIALVNDKLLSAGKSTLGFLNPLLYANPSALNDIISGSNPGCGTNGFSAKSGW
ncbi:hypothetical protein HDV03_004904 [Kappamyces sp. JEL0829]|nr:hypothetical protein HDV03_004904 [Kappamyces sp. JEL0829]